MKQNNDRSFIGQFGAPYEDTYEGTCIKARSLNVVATTTAPRKGRAIMGQRIVNVYCRSDHKTIWLLECSINVTATKARHNTVHKRLFFLFRQCMSLLNLIVVNCSLNVITRGLMIENCVNNTFMSINGTNLHRNYMIVCMIQ